MGYTLRIGEARLFYSNEDGEYDAPHCDVEVEGFAHDSAPAFGEPTDTESQRWPSYTAWGNFCDAVGLNGLFFDEERGLMREHPGTCPLTVGHQATIDKAYKDFMAKYPNAVATYGKKIGQFEWDPENPKENNWLCRLEWLKYWVDWALKFCDKPAFGNS